LCITLSFRFFEKYPTGISVSQDHIPMQPMDIGIIKNLKTLCYSELVNYIFEAIEENLLTSSSRAKVVSARTDLLQAVEFIDDSWQRVSTETVQNCFAYCDFKHSDLEMADKAHSEMTSYYKYTTSKITKFSCIDNSLQCYNENKDCEDATVEQIGAKHQKTSEYQETDEEDTIDCERVTDHDARNCIAGFRLCFMQECNEGSPISALETCADFVQLQ
jgi:hypothetical protein